MGEEGQRSRWAITECPAVQMDPIRVHEVPVAYRICMWPGNNTSKAAST